jgi:hypothetical protein
LNWLLASAFNLIALTPSNGLYIANWQFSDNHISMASPGVLALTPGSDKIG